MSESKIIHQKTKTLITKDNGRSADAISPNFVYGCLGGCMDTYCYVGRFNKDKVYINGNIHDIFLSMTEWVDRQPWPKVPNQTDPEYYTIDIGCSTDVALHFKQMPMQEIYQYFNGNPKAKSTFATKYPSNLVGKLEKYSINSRNHRIRISLMPQIYSSVLEPNTDKILERIGYISYLQNMGYEVHLNFSPVIVTEGWQKQYIKLFEELSAAAIDLPCEVIFLTYNQKQADLQGNITIKYLLNRSEWQEPKDSQYAPGNLRYKHDLKAHWVKEFAYLHGLYFKSKIRYIF